jgi:hypothetical protein
MCPVQNNHADWKLFDLRSILIYGKLLYKIDLDNFEDQNGLRQKKCQTHVAIKT